MSVRTIRGLGSNNLQYITSVFAKVQNCLQIEGKFRMKNSVPR